MPRPSKESISESDINIWDAFGGKAAGGEGLAVESQTWNPLMLVKYCLARSAGVVLSYKVLLHPVWWLDPDEGCARSEKSLRMQADGRREAEVEFLGRLSF